MLRCCLCRFFSFDEAGIGESVGLPHNISCIAFGLAVTGEVVHIQFPSLFYLKATEGVTGANGCILASDCNETVLAKILDVTHPVGLPGKS